MKASAPVLLWLACTWLLAAPASAQQLYKYVGPDGKVQYSDRPPADGGKAERITRSRVGSVSSGAAASAAGGEAAKSTAPRSPAEQEQEFRARQLKAKEKAAKDAKLAEEKRLQEESCAAARRQLAGLQSGARVTRLNERGEQIFLEEDQIQQEIQRVQREVAASCR